MDRIAPDLGFDLPLRFLGALHFLVLGGLATWETIDDALDEHAGLLARQTAEQQVQTNEVQRTWALLPVFLALADGRPLDLLELGPSGGLNLVWDRYAYRYRSGTWGESELTLGGDDRVSPPEALLARPVTAARRRGIDRSPVDVTTEEGARLLQSFVWPDQAARLDRLRHAIHVVRSDPPELLEGDYVELLPELLADRIDGAQLLVWETASASYLAAEQLERLRRAMARAGQDEPFAFVSTGYGPEGVDGYSLNVYRWPAGDVTRLAVCDFHGEWLEWGR